MKDLFQTAFNCYFRQHWIHLKSMFGHQTWAPRSVPRGFGWSVPRGFGWSVPRGFGLGAAAGIRFGRCRGDSEMSPGDAGLDEEVIFLTPPEAVFQSVVFYAAILEVEKVLKGHREQILQTGPQRDWRRLQQTK
ncbi:hypothetical protein Lbir_0407 [Legionella birminghamensis]|uniref:Uncharacterized protein n=1 Tax=Legionella birminghamensis TaxID=28083 RepID=A0A378IDX6_9GAMM|nr:hypothetical protein Lbir_0407 [Legionella birminghamensis]STX32721.1 Uncharacterised protein [Legionella birminghamensis]